MPCASWNWPFPAPVDPHIVMKSVARAGGARARSAASAGTSAGMRRMRESPSGPVEEECTDRGPGAGFRGDERAVSGGETRLADDRDAPGDVEPRGAESHEADAGRGILDSGQRDAMGPRRHAGDPQHGDTPAGGVEHLE